MDQGSQEWLDWRAKGIGASDMPVLFGLSDKTPFMLWQEKMGLTTSSISTYARGKGGETEARLRAKYSLETGRQYGPVLAAHDEYPWLLASLDGYAVEGEGKDRIQHLLEIKFVGKAVYDLGEVPPKHMVQCQQQMLVVQENFCIYLMSMDGDMYKEIVIHADPAMQAEIIQRGTLFYSYMHTKTPPPLTDGDWWPGSEALAQAVAANDRTLIKSLMPNKRVQIPGYKLTITSSGTLRVTKQGEPC